MNMTNKENSPVFKSTSSANLTKFVRLNELSCENIDAATEIAKLKKECDTVLQKKYYDNNMAEKEVILPKETLLMADAKLNCQFNAMQKNISEHLPVIAVDAGGTNLRVVILAEKSHKRTPTTFKKTSMPDLPGNLEFLYYKKYHIPGSESPVTAAEFFESLVNFMKPALDNPSSKNIKTVQFCFSYPFTFDEKGNAIVGTLTKEIQVEGIAGTAIDATLKQAINKKYGFERISEIVILNDTSATLLSNLIEEVNSDEKTTSSHKQQEYIRLGLVLGTGFNIAYMGKNPKRGGRLSIFNTEIGNYTGFTKNSIDIEVEKNSDNPGKGRTEKSISGSYLGKQATIILQKGCKFGLLPLEKHVLPNGKLRAEDVAAFLILHKKLFEKPSSSQSTEFSKNILKRIEGLLQLSGKYQTVVHSLFLLLIERASLLTAICTCAVIAHSKTKFPACSKTLLNLNGSVVVLLPHFKDFFVRHLATLQNHHNTEVEIKIIDRAPTIGSIFARKA